ncbi:hypothetical protein ACFX5U_14655 [Sphingobacterium sp. SG20118]|uniref:hypothetical protein n=1 Tax=Sphingobacterium sp. SG20118 TaxID=3367156 RepID=UPI0037DFBFC2
MVRQFENSENQETKMVAPAVKQFEFKPQDIRKTILVQLSWINNLIIFSRCNWLTSIGNRAMVVLPSTTIISTIIFFINLKSVPEPLSSVLFCIRHFIKPLLRQSFCDVNSDIHSV